MTKLNKQGTSRQLPRANAKSSTRKRDHYDITTAQLLDSAFDKTAYLEWLGGRPECDRVARIMLPFLVVSTSQGSANAADGQRVAS